MNIIKIKDIVLTEGLDNIEKFNSNFRGKYTYLINGYCIPIYSVYPVETLMMLDTVMYKGNPTSEEQVMINNLISASYTLDELYNANVIDSTLTSKTNASIESKYKMLNDYIPSDITAEEVKKFRTWLASTILAFNIIEDTDITHMLDYYAHGMYNDVVQALVSFGSVTVVNPVVNLGGSCGCNKPTTNTTTLVDCDALAIYRKNIYLKMIEVFSNLDFWMEFDPEFLQMFKLYIDNILKMGLLLTSDTYMSDFADCTCQIDTNTEQRMNEQRLTKLSQSLQYMIDGNLTSHRLYINSSLADWATYLYEMMEWN